ncbi:hypothetical protein WN55_11404 [Dufourea novaeangliae]|uniref:Uncharacterized protein n=1 Tax=Dufourea novaeangliae TaxID=178035 RepID=A0A154PAP2_DUFNO|nr:hypothetical protein WN55_11404 [Dufourea novaeangliae]
MEAVEEPIDDHQQSVEKIEDPGRLRVLSVDKVTLEKYVLESSTGSREVLLTKNESSRKLSIKSELSRSSRNDRKGSTNAKNRCSLSEEALLKDNLPVGSPSNETGSKSREASLEKRIKPIRLTKSPSIGSIVVISPKRTKIPPKIPDKPVSKNVLPDSSGSERSKTTTDSAEVRQEEEFKGSSDNGLQDLSTKQDKGLDAKNRLDKSQSKIEVLQQNLTTKIDANTADSYKKLLDLRAKLPILVDSNANEKPLGEFDEEFLRKQSLDSKLKIEEHDSAVELDRVINGEGIEKTVKPGYSKKVSEIEKRWSGEFLERRRSSESSKSSYVEEFGSVSSRESVGEDRGASLYPERLQEDQDSITERQTSEEVLTVDSTDISTVDSDSCLEDRIKAVDEDIENAEIDDEIDDVDQERMVDLERIDGQWKSQSIGRKRQHRNTDSRSGIASSTDSIDLFVARRSSPGRDGYASLIKEFTMEAATTSKKKEEKQKKKLGLRRLLPGFFSPKDSRKDYKKKESKEKKRQDDRHFARYQQNGNYTRSPDTMNLNEDIKRNVKLDNSLNGSMIEERLDEIKRELFPDQGPITSTPDYLAREDDRALLRDRTGPPRSYTTDSSLSSIAPDDRWAERNAHLGISPDIRKYEQRQKREEVGRGQLERKHSLQEPNNRYFFHRNHGPSGRISAPPNERYLVRPRAIHPIDRPLPAIPHSRTNLNCENFLEEDPREAIDLYENHNASGLMPQSVSAQVKITTQPIVNQNHKAPLVGRSSKYSSPGSSQKSGEYADSSCTPNSSQKSEFSPSSSKSGEYYLHSPGNSGSPTNGKDLDERDEVYVNEKSPSRSSTRCMDDRIYDETPLSPCDDRSTPTNSNQLERSREEPTDLGNTSNQSPSKGSQGTENGSQGKQVSPRGLTAQAKRAQPNEQILIASPKRELAYETRIPRPTNETRRIESPVNIGNSPLRLPSTVEARGYDSPGSQDFSGTKTIFQGQRSTPSFSPGIPRPEPVYVQRNVASQPVGHRPNVQKKDSDDRVAWIQGRTSSPVKSPQRPSPRIEKTDRGANQQPTKSPCHQVQVQKSRIPAAQNKSPVSSPGHPESTTGSARSVDESSVYVQRIPEPVYVQREAVSPSKQKTRQHLEAFYWQQKALEAHRKSLASPGTANSGQIARKIDLPEVREAVYWQQLKRLDEELQRRIYEQNLAEESSCCSKSPSRPRQGSLGYPVQQWTENLRRAKGIPSGKPPLMQSQKGPNQPVLIVRPQQAVQNRREMQTKPLDPPRLEAQRSKSASPHFHRGEPHVTQRKMEPTSYIDVNDDSKGAPHPIFKRGSLVGGDSVDYGTSGGAKRVSFSNQLPPGQDLPAGSWPTKHGPAPEPPTRRHRSEDSTSDTDSVFSHDRRDPAHYPESEYDADRPLPPLPRDLANARSPAAARCNLVMSPYGDLRWQDLRRVNSPSVTPEQLQRVLRQKGE